MAIRAKRPCAAPGCNQLTEARYCEAHRIAEQRRYDATRGSTTKRGYGNMWQSVRAQKLTLNPLCEHCTAQGQVRPATLVHHKDRNPHNNSMGNLESLCIKHHDIEHKEEKFGRH